MSTYLQTAIEDASALEAPPATSGAMGQPIEGYRSDPTGEQCSLGPQPGAKALVRELGARFGGRGGIFNCRPVRGGKRLSLHGEGRAVDWYRNVKDPAEAAEAQRIIDWLLASDGAGNQHALVRRMGIQEIIWNRRIWTARRSAEGWRAYSGVNPHTDHLHIGMNWPGARMETSHWKAHAPAAPAPAAPAAPPAPAPAAAAGTTTFGSAADIDAFFQARTGKHFLDWFNATQSDRGAWEPKTRNGKVVRHFTTKTDAETKRRFNLWWDAAPAAVFGRPRITLEQFVALQSILVNELGGSMKPLTEGYRGGSPGHRGLAYLFDHIPENGKASYNAPAPGKEKYWGNRTALQCFNDPDFIAAHGHRTLGAKLARTTDPAWGGRTYPAGIPTDARERGAPAKPDEAAFVAEADFCKFRGRGMIQTTFRVAYKPIVEYVQTYTGAHAKVVEYRTRWAGMDPEKVLTRSSNDDWDDLFQNTDYLIACAGVRLHARRTKYLEISPDAATRLGTKAGSFHDMGRKISGSPAYGDKFKRRCVQIIDALKTAPAAQSLADEESGPPASSTLVWPSGTAEQLAFMRRVYDRQVANSARRGRFVANVPGGQLGDIESGQRARTAAAAAMVALLKEARQALDAAKAAGDERAAKIGSLRVASGYRSVSTQFNNWQGAFPRYYAETRDKRTAAVGGEHGAEAEKLLAKFIGGILGAPGYSLHNDGRAIDLGTRNPKNQPVLGPSKSQRAAWRASWFWTWLTKHAETYGYFQNTKIDEPWHWEYRGPATPAAAHSLAVSLGAVSAGQAEIENVALLASHQGAGPELILRWNAIHDPAAGVDVVVHLHGFSSDRNLDLRDRKLPLAGLDFGPPAPPRGSGAREQPAWTGRTRPTLLVIPRGQARPGHASAYGFPALAGDGAFAQLVDIALRNFETHAGIGQRVSPRRIVLTAHSGGGAAMNRILTRTAGTPVDPHEVHVFDALYGRPDGLSAWLRRRLGRDVERLRAGVPDARAYLAAEGGALRVLYTPGGEKSTQPSSLQIEKLVRDLVPRGLPGSDLLELFYRVERSAVAHSHVPYWYGGRLLADAAAQIAGPAARVSGARSLGDGGYAMASPRWADEPVPAYLMATPPIPGDDVAPGPFGGDPVVAAYAEQLARTWHARGLRVAGAKKAPASPEEVLAWLASAYDETVPKVAEKVSLRHRRGAWMMARREEIEFLRTGYAKPRYAEFARVPDNARDRALIPEHVRGKCAYPKVAPGLAAFLGELGTMSVAGAPIRFTATNRKDHHRTGSHLGQGLSVDVYVPKKTLPGFFLRQQALDFFQALHELAGRKPGTQWTALYNDFSVADVVNRKVGHTAIGFKGKAKNFHGPNPLLLHIHLEVVVPEDKGAPA